MIRIGQGSDIHALVEGRKLIIGGVDIPHERGLLGHSDADVLVHAVIDALLGAAALGDIGRHFPDTDPRYAGADSRVLLRATRELLAARGWRIVNVDSTISAQRPKMAPHIPQMTANLFTYNYRQMIWASIILGWIDCIAGLYISYLLNVPSGATIIFISIVVFALAKIVLGIRRKMPDKQ